MAGVVDLAGPLLPVLGVGDGTAEGVVDPAEVLGVGVPVGVPAVGVGLAGADPVGVADGVLDWCVVCRCCGCREVWPLNELPSGGLPTASWTTMMPAMTMMKNTAAMPL